MSLNTEFIKSDELASISISKDPNGNYYVSFAVIVQVEPFLKPKTTPIGIDLGYKNICTTNVKVNSINFHHLPEEIDAIDAKISELQSKLDKHENYRIEHGINVISNRDLELKRQLKELITLKSNMIDQFETDFAIAVASLNPAWVCMEHLSKKQLYKDVKKKNKYADPKLKNVHTYSIRMKVKRQCIKHGIPFFEADPYFASSQICSRCGNRYKVGSSRVYECSYCGNMVDRDLNASYNLAKYPITHGLIQPDPYILTLLGFNILVPQIPVYQPQMHTNPYVPIYAPIIQYGTSIPYNNYNQYEPIIKVNNNELREMASIVNSRYLANAIMAYKVDNSRPRENVVMAVKVK